MTTQQKLDICVKALRKICFPAPVTVKEYQRSLEEELSEYPPEGEDVIAREALEQIGEFIPEYIIKND